MTSPGWLGGLLAALMIVIAAAATARIVRGKTRNGMADADALHVLMGVAMAGMFEPRLRAVPAVIWVAAFTVAATWFGWQAARGRGRNGPGARSGHPVVHVIECGAMVYMLWPAGSYLARQRAASGMTRMAVHAGAMAGNPAVALVLAAFVIGYVLWTIDQLSSRSRSAVGGARSAPRLAACQKITMSLAMGYMLVTML